MASCCTFVDILTTWSRVGLSETRFATAKVGAYCVGTSWVWWTVVWSNRTLVNINTSAGSLVSPTCQTDAAVGTWSIRTPWIWWTTVRSHQALVNIDAGVCTSISPIRPTITAVWTNRIDTWWLSWASISFLCTFIRICGQRCMDV